jgi:hypothetical protein
MTRLRTLILIICSIGAIAAPLVAAPAASASSAQVIADCNAHGNLTRHYSVAELRSALATMSADVKEYTDCYDVIQRALLAALGGLHGGGGDGPGQGGSGGAFLPAPLIALLVLLGLGAATLAALAIRRRSSESGASSGSS